MAGVDLILLAALLFSMAVGAWRGLVYEVLSVLGWALSFYAAQWLAPDVASRLPLDSVAEPLRYVAAFVLIFVGAIFTSGLLASLLKKLIEAIGLRPVDRMLGALFGLLRGLILLLAVTVVVNMTAMKTSEEWQGSQGAAVLDATLKALKPVLPDKFSAYLG